MSGIEPRTVIFASKGDLPKVLRKFFKEANIPVIRATPAEDHAEIAARDFGRNVQLQEQTLGGRMLRVNSAITTNRVCARLDCAEALTEFIGDPEVTIQPGGFGLSARQLNS